MANTVNIDVIINASKNAKTLKEQREALLGVRDALDEVKFGSGAFELLNEEAIRLSSSIGNLNLTFEDVHGSVKPLTSGIGELEDRMHAMFAAGEQNSAGFRELQDEVVRLKTVVREVDDTIDAFAQKDAKLLGIIGVAQGIAGAFTVAQSALGLFGVKNETLEKSLLGVANAMALLSGLEAISRSIKEKNIITTFIQSAQQKLVVRLVGQETVAKAQLAVANGTATVTQTALNLAMSLNPMALIIIAVLALTAAYVIFAGSTEDIEKSNNKLNDSFAESEGHYDRLHDKNIRNNANKLKTAELEGATEAELLAIRLEGLRLIEQKRTEDLARIVELNTKKRVELKKAFAADDEDLAKSIQDEILANTEKYRVLHNLAGQFEEDVKQTKLASKNVTDKNDATELAKDIAKSAAKLKENREFNAKLREQERQAIIDRAADADIINLEQNVTNAKRNSLFTASMNRESLELAKAIAAEKKKLADGIATAETERAESLLKVEKDIAEKILKAEKAVQKNKNDNAGSFLSKGFSDRRKALQKDLDDNKAALQKLINDKDTLIQTEKEAGLRRHDNTKIALERNALTAIEKLKQEHNIRVNEIEVKAGKKSSALSATLRKDKVAEATAAVKLTEKLLDESQRAINIAQDRINTAQLSGYQKELVALRNNNIEKTDISIVANEKTISLIEKELENGFITQEEATRKIEESNSKHKKRLLLADEQFGIDSSVLNSKIQDETLRVTNETNKLFTENDIRLKLDAKNRELKANEGDETLTIKARLDKKLEIELKYQDELKQLQADRAKNELDILEQQKGVFDKEMAESESQNAGLLAVNKEALAEQLKLDQSDESVKANVTKLNADIASLEAITENNNKKKLFTEKKFENDKAKVNDDFNKTEIEGAEAVAAAQQKIDEAAQTALENRVNTVNQYVDLAQEALNILANMQDENTQRALSDLQEETDARLQAFDDRIAAENMLRENASIADYQALAREKEIAKERSDIEFASDEKRKEIERKQWKRQKAFAIAQAAINAAQAIIVSLAFAPLAIGILPNPAGISSLALAITTGALQVGAVAATQEPKFQAGGILQGPSHIDGGIKTQFGELEGGEAVINKNSTKLFGPMLSKINEIGGGKRFSTSGGVVPIQEQSNDKLNRIESLLEYYADTASRPILTYVNESAVTRAQRNSEKIDKRTSF